MKQFGTSVVRITETSSVLLLKWRLIYDVRFTAVIQAFQQSDLLTVAVVVIRGFQIKGQVTQNRMVNHALKGSSPSVPFPILA